jgi:cytochrome c peroxidase
MERRRPGDELIARGLCAWTRTAATGALACAVLAAFSQGAIADGFAWRLPAGFPQPAVPEDNPMSAAKVALGRRLFSDPRLSITGRHSCASCHDPQRAFTDGRALARGATGDEVPLNSPTLLNVAYNASFGWRDTGVRTLEEQMRGPLFNEHPRELGLAGLETHVIGSLIAERSISTAFAAAFPAERSPVTMGNVIRAIAAYQRTLFAGDSPFDRYAFAGDHAALDEPQKRGMALFFSERSGCARCHGGINFAGEWVDREHPDATARFADTGAGPVRVPTLRNLARTAPYLHDGRATTLDAVLDNYERLASDPAADPLLRRAPLTTEERAALRAFLGALDDSR